MAISVSFGDTNSFNAMLYTPKHSATLNFLENQVNRLTEYGSSLTEAGKSFFANTAQMFNTFNGAEALRLARAAVKRIDNVFQSNEIKYISELPDIQNASLNMQRWIMANPIVRELYNNQRCDGYSDTYADMSPGTIGESHYDYRRITEGLVREVVGEDGITDDVTTFYFDDLHEGDRELNIDEQMDILNTWDIIESYIKNGKSDPTSLFNNNL